MAKKPTYEELEQQINALQNKLKEYTSRDSAVNLREQYLRAILDNTNLPIYLKDGDYNYLLVNRAYERLAHITNDQIAGKDDFAVFPEPIAELFRSQDEEVKQRKTLVEFTETLELADGEHTFVTEKFPLINSEGNIYAVGGVCTDITSLQKTQDSLRASEERYSSFIENFHGIAYRGNIRSFTPIYFHGAVENITGYTEQEFLEGNPRWDQVLHPDYLPMVHEDGKKMLAITDYSFRREYRIIRKDGEERWIFETGRNICDEHDMPAWIEGTIYDITSRKNAENALKESEEKYRKLFTNEIDPISIFDIETREFLDVNDAFLNLYGYTREEVLKLKADDMSAEPEKTQEAIKKSGVEGETLVPVRHHRKKDGTQITVEISAGPFTWKGRKVMYAIMRDITAQVKTEEALRESEEKYRALVETATQGIQISDLEGRIIFSNPAHHAIHGLQEGQIVGKYVWDFVESEDEKEKLRKYYASIIEQQPVPEPYLAMNKTADGRDIYVQVNWNYMRDNNGKISAISSIINDITERIQTEKELRSSEKRFRSVIESSPEGMMMYRLEPDGRLIFTDANPAADLILGVDCVQFIGKTIEEAFPPLALTEIPERYREVCRTGKPWRTEQLSYEDDQISGAFDVHAFQTEPGKMALFFADITKKKRMEEEIQKIQKLESVGILAGGIAHDFNNLLTAILGNISMAKIFTQTGENSLDRLTDAEKATLRARDLTQQLLTFSKGGAPVKTTGSIRELIEDSASFMLSGSNVTYEIISPDDLWAVEMDEGQISQVIQNVVKNSDQAMPDGGKITIQADNVSVTGEDAIPLPDGKFIQISIIDQGVGIIPKHLAKIFDPYFSTKQDGSGLGMAASFSIIKNHGGLITVESARDSGTTFHIYLPASEKKPAEKKKEKDKLLRSGEKILIMDDDQDVLNVADNMLNLMGYKTETASDGTEAVQLFMKAKEEGQPFDGAILDLTIPGGMGGLETAKQLSRIDDNVKTIVSSGYANDPIMADFSEHGFSGVIAKPYTMEKLGGVLRKIFT